MVFSGREFRSETRVHVEDLPSDRTLMEQQLSEFGLQSFMDTITYVTDRGANFLKAFRSNKVLLCVVHRMNNVLKRCFYQNPSKKSTHSPDKLVHTTTSSEATPVKMKTMTTACPTASPEIEESNFKIDEEESESEEDETDDDCDYTVTTIAQLPVSAGEFLDTIKHCKAPVRYIKKVWNEKYKFDEAFLFFPSRQA
ncbi:unnamed protein product [Didymodactylos carnosus]|uniref:Uncharacterized protein n=1 Tax=Didymodactylos carnosus TaxID=1234261 RepID=A0A814RS63_9BILA|nr:unnamed protein product [Didymodactylos carnosus]CAF3901916.1 unnamed protein product [Didymodactylos carnosus]